MVGYGKSLKLGQSRANDSELVASPSLLQCFMFKYFSDQSSCHFLVTCTRTHELLCRLQLYFIAHAHALISKSGSSNHRWSLTHQYENALHRQVWPPQTSGLRLILGLNHHRPPAVSAWAHLDHRTSVWNEKNIDFLTFYNQKAWWMAANKRSQRLKGQKVSQFYNVRLC